MLVNSFTFDRQDSSPDGRVSPFAFLERFSLSDGKHHNYFGKPAMPNLEVLDHSTIYRNSCPNTVSEYVAFPSVCALKNDTLLCLCRHGSARESNDALAKVHRSIDGGRTWQCTGPLPNLPGPDGGAPRSPGGFGVTQEGDVIAWAACETGDDERTIYSVRSQDGIQWSDFALFEIAPYPVFYLCMNLARLPDGTLVIPGEAPGGRCPEVPSDHWAGLVSRSTDDGRTWESVRSAHVSKNPFYMDLRLTALNDGRILGVYWTHDMEKDIGLNVHTTFSEDAGRTWTEPQDAGFWGQVTDVCELQSGRVIAVTNHRRDPLGIRAILSEDGGQSFDEANHMELWGVVPAQVRSAPVLAPKRDVVDNVMHSYHHFTFGTPSVTQLSDGTIIAAFYVTEESVTYVRCCRLKERD